MADQLGWHLDQARELLQDLEQRPSPYVVLGVTRETPATDIHKAFSQALIERKRTGYSPQDITQARDQLKNERKRLELDAQHLDRDQWQQELDALRNRYALFDFLADLRGR